jgi:Tol biopolymer transport system component
MKLWNINPFLASCLLIFLISPAAPQAAQTIDPTATRLVSADSAGIHANSISGAPSISSDGRFVAFTSAADNLVVNDINNVQDIFVRDTMMGTTVRVSVDSSGNEANGSSYDPRISSTGEFVVFASQATNLAGGDTNSFEDIFFHDMQTGETSRISINNSGTQGNGLSEKPSISADGRFVAFCSVATNLVNGDTNQREDVFVRDRQTNSTVLVSAKSDGTLGNGFSYNSSISANGRYVTFTSYSNNLVLADRNGKQDIFVRDLQGNTLKRVSIRTNGVEGTLNSDSPVISADGRFIAFASDSALVDGITPGTTRIYIRDQQENLTEIGVNAGADVSSPSISDDGRYVAFVSDTNELDRGDTNQTYDVFLKDRQKYTNFRLSIDSGGLQGNDWSGYPSISGDGQFLTFASLATNLVDADSNGAQDIFLIPASGYLAGKTRLVIQKTGAGSGTVTSGPDGILCGSDCLGWFANDSTVILSGQPGYNSSFAGWDGTVCSGIHPCAVTMNTPKTINASFNDYVTLNIISGFGIVTVLPAQAHYYYGDIVTLTAVPAPGYHFLDWSGDVAGTSNPIDVTITGSMTIIANYNNENLPLQNITAITAGAYHTCALTTHGEIRCWGANSFGQLGDGSTNPSNSPLQVNEALRGFTAVSAGSVHTCGLTDAGGVKCWGANGYGQLGNHSTSNSYIPVNVEYFPGRIRSISAGENHTCAVTMEGGAYCWGEGDHGELGNGFTTSSSYPQTVYGLSEGVLSISAGSYHTCALITGGAVKCWGWNFLGQLGNGTNVDHSVLPVDVSGLSNGVAALSAGGFFTCAQMDAGPVKCWGANDHGQTGDGTTIHPRSSPVVTLGLGNEVSLFGTSDTAHSCAFTPGTGIKCWGFNRKGQLGDFTTVDSSIPVDVIGLDHEIEISELVGGTYHSCALRSNSTVLCWGGNEYGQLGVGSNGDVFLPAMVIDIFLPDIFPPDFSFKLFIPMISR